MPKKTELGELTTVNLGNGKTADLPLALDGITPIITDAGLLYPDVLAAVALATITTGETNDHTHAIADEATETSAADGHTHPVIRNDAGAVTGVGPGGENEHTHTVASDLSAHPDNKKPKKKPFADAKMAAIKLFKIRDVEIFRTGIWHGRSYKRKDLDELVTNFEQADFRPPVKLGHSEPQGLAAVGWVESVRRVGDVLIADLMDIPREVFDAIKAHSFDTISSEIFFNLTRGTKKFRIALKAIALLGAELPAVAGLKPLRESSFAETEYGRIHVVSFEIKEPKMLTIKELTAKLEAAQASLKKVAEGDDELAIAQLSTEVAEIQAEVFKAEKVEALAAKDKAEKDATAAAEKAKGATADPVQVQKMQDTIDDLKKRVEASDENARIASVQARVDKCRLPAFREHFAALYDLVTKPGVETVVFSTTDEKGKATKSSVDPIKVVDDLLDRMNKRADILTAELSAGDDFHRDDDEPSSKDAGTEVDRLTQIHMDKHDGVKYGDALQVVLKAPENRELAELYQAS